FEAHHARVFRAAYRVTGNVSDAEDVTQTVFLRLLRRDHDTARKEVENLESYLYRAALNVALDVVRARRASGSIPLGEAEHVAQQDPSSSPERRHSSGEVRAWLREAVTRLHRTAAEMFVLRYFEGHDNREVARLMSTSESVVAVTLHRTRTRLQEQFRLHMGEVR
ncbi:MAG: RNA polymerase sigma factor, partial [Bryobacteraceae bacterium]